MLTQPNLTWEISSLHVALLSFTPAWTSDLVGHKTQQYQRHRTGRRSRRTLGKLGDSLLASKNRIVIWDLFSIGCFGETGNTHTLKNRCQPSLEELIMISSVFENTEVRVLINKGSRPFPLKQGITMPCLKQVGICSNLIMQLKMCYNHAG